MVKCALARVRVPDSIRGAVNTVVASDDIVVVGGGSNVVMLVRP